MGTQCVAAAYIKIEWVCVRAFVRARGGGKGSVVEEEGEAGSFAQSFSFGGELSERDSERRVF